MSHPSDSVTSEESSVNDEGMASDSHVQAGETPVGDPQNAEVSDESSEEAFQEANVQESSSEDEVPEEGRSMDAAAEVTASAAVTPKNENFGWYIVNCQTSCENVARMAIQERVQARGMEKHFGEILIPSESVVQLVKGKKQTRSRKFFPGYIFVNMEMNEATWHLVRKSSKVTGFIGGQNPKPVTQAEVDRVTQQMVEGAERPKPKVTFSIGDTVTVVDGPFSSFAGSVEEINEEKAKVKVSISVFGRPTPVELDFIQVEKS